MPCDTCDYAAPRFRCSHHALMWGVVKELHHSMLEGHSWGDLEYYWDEDRIANETPEQKAQRALKAMLDKMKEDQQRKESKINKFVDKQTGRMPTVAYKKLCKYADTPATVDRQGVSWAAGCELKRAGKCPFLHPGDEGYEELKSGKFSVPLRASALIQQVPVYAGW
jgi:hypothetical protein